MSAAATSAWASRSSIPARIPGHPGEQWDRRPLTLEQVRGLQDTGAQAGITGGRRHPRSQDHLI